MLGGMGIQNYLIEGLSGVGKTTVAEELERRGLHVIHGDRNFAYYGDPASGASLDWPPLESEAERIAWGYPRWIWPVARVRALAADRSHAMTFFCGGTRNLDAFIDVFDAIFVLRVGLDALNRRLARRPDDEFGGRPLEREWIRRLHSAGEGVPEAAIGIDADRPVAAIVDDILSKCGKPG